MDSGIETTQITELKNLKKQLQWWRYSLLGATVFVVVATIATVDGAVKGLTQKGPRQDQYVAEVTSSLKNDIAPMVQEMVKQTVDEVKPEIEQAVHHVNSRLPEVAEKAMAEFELLQSNLPKKGEKVLNDTFVAMLHSKEAKLKEMFPEATEEQIEKLLNNLGESCKDQASFANTELFAKHQAALQDIHRNLMTIHEAEKDNLAGVEPGWEMAVLVLDLFKEDIQSVRPDLNGGASADDSFGSEDAEVRSAKKVVASAPKEATEKNSTKKVKK
ncbi:MAG: hypothetical protein JSS65_12360 [Armatimonadetes bacterium]|nr:hypothetical protein [Armatimonadota bacterium]